MRATDRTLKSLMVAVLATCALCALAAVQATAATPKPWATVNVCNTPKFPYTVGVRASMPPGAKGTTMFIRIKLQYRLGSEVEWREVLRGGDTGKLKVGTSKGVTRQAGSNFKFGAPAAGVIPDRSRVARKASVRSPPATSRGAR